MRRLFSTVFALSLASFAIAQDQNDQGADPPSRAARLGYINGAVSFQPGGVDDWVPAEPNRPMTTGDRLWTDDNSRVEMNLGSAAFRLGSRTNFTFLNLDDRTAQIQLSVGTLSVHLRRLAGDETVEIDTPQVAFTLLRPGEYRIEVTEQGDATIVTVRAGDGEATANGQAFPVHAREQVRIAGLEGADPILDRRMAPASDSFDLFCQDRDRREDMSRSARYVSRDMPGYADLDANGSWSDSPDYGPVWVPSSVPVGWSPYHYGHWAWIAPWGWTWVDDAPWGYAPFHYGRWAMVGASWGWIPGPIAVRPVYAPAMVAFVGGGGFSAAISIGGGGAAVGWFPLGPREVWVPSYHVSAGYMTRVNVSNTVVSEVNVRNTYTNVYVNHSTVVNNVYVNQRVPGGMVAVRGDAMVSGRAIGAVAVRVPPNAVANVAVVHAAPVAPERSAVLGGRAPEARGMHMPPPAAMNRQVVAKAAPPPAPVPFVRQQEALRANPGRPLDQGAVRNLQTSQPAPSMNFRPAAPNAPAARVPYASPANSNPAGRNMNGGRPPVNAPVNPPVNSVAPRPNPEVRPAPVVPNPAPEPRRDMRPENIAPRPNPEVRPAPVAPTPAPEPRRDVRPENVRPENVAPRPNPEFRPAPAAPTPAPAPRRDMRPENVAPRPNPEVRPAPPAPTPAPAPRQEARPENVAPRPNPEVRPAPAPPTPAPAPRREMRPENVVPRPNPEVRPAPAPPPPAPAPRQEARPEPAAPRPAPPQAAPRNERPPQQEQNKTEKAPAKKTDKPEKQR